MKKYIVTCSMLSLGGGKSSGEELSEADLNGVDVERLVSLGAIAVSDDGEAKPKKARGSAPKVAEEKPAEAEVKDAVQSVSDDGEAKPAE